MLLADAFRCMELMFNFHGLEVDDIRMEGGRQLIIAEVGTTRMRPILVEPVLIARCAVGSGAFYMPLYILLNMCLHQEPAFLTMLGNAETGTEGSLLEEIAESRIIACGCVMWEVNDDGIGNWTWVKRWIAYPRRHGAALKIGVLQQVGGPLEGDINYQGFPQHKSPDRKRLPRDGITGA
jgi:hypothetical protein